MKVQIDDFLTCEYFRYTKTEDIINLLNNLERFYYIDTERVETLVRRIGKIWYIDLGNMSSDVGSLRYIGYPKDVTYTNLEYLLSTLLPRSTQPESDDKLNKQEAAAFLCISIRTLERYTQQGKINVTYIKNNNNNTIATYDKKELIDFKTKCNDVTTSRSSRNNKSIAQHKEKKIIEVLPTKTNTSEIDLQFQIKSWIDLCVDNANFNIEHPLLNTLNDKTETRRLDFIKIDKDEVTVYELKLGLITLDIVTSTIARKGYYHLVKEKFDRDVKFVFLSPVGIEKEAQILLDAMPDFKFQLVSNLSEQYYNKGVEDKWKISKWYLDKQVKDIRFINLFSNNFLNSITNS